MGGMKKRLFVLAASALVVGATGCSGGGGKASPDDKGQTPKEQTIATIPTDVKDSSDLPDWTGKQLDLTIWFAHGPNADIDKRTSQGNVVDPEIKRVTGVSLNKEKWFDNAGQTAEVKMGMLAASNNWPDIASNVPADKLVEAGKLYDLTELLPAYAPNIMKKVPKSMASIWDTDIRVNGGKPGKIYGVPMNIRDVEVEGIDKSKSLSAPPTGYDFVWVRDDVVKKLYPNAKTQKEIEDLFVKNGKFTKEEIFDVPINSKDDFYNFLREIQKLNLKEGGQPIYPIFTASATDNFPLLTNLSGILNGFTSRSNYFSYWDKEAATTKWMFKEPFFKQTVKEMNQLLREGVASKEAFVDPSNVFRQKLDSGLYAVSYSYHTPNNDLLEKAGKPFRYRKVYLNIPPNDKKFVMAKPMPIGNENIVIFKDKVKEEDVPQILRWLDYLASDAGEKLRAWGPRSAGLFEEKDGQRVFKDKELEEHMVYGKASEKGLYYNLWNGGRESGLRTGYFSYLTNNKGKFHPENTYEKKRDPKLANNFFHPGRIEPLKQVETALPHVWNYTSELPELDKAWKARKAFEDALTKTLAASSEAEFEKLFSEFLAVAEASGYNDSVLKQIDDMFRKKNAAYMNNLK
jgi:hypothetical protein